MERAAKSKKKVMKFVPGTVSALSFQNPVLSPKRVGHAAAKGFSGPLVPDRKKKDETQEPSSPKVSCMGQIKHKKKSGKPKPSNSVPATIIKFLGKTWAPIKSGDLKKKKVPLVDRAPSLGQMKRFASGRDNFDWTAQITPVDVELQPRKEVNLWKRRSMAPPLPLRLLKIDTSNS